MPRVCTKIIIIKNITASSIKCQKTELTNLRTILDIWHTCSKNNVQDTNNDSI